MTKNEFAIKFLQWRDEHFHMHGVMLYYPKIGSKYYDTKKHIGRVGDIECYTASNLLEMFKSENP